MFIRYLFLFFIFLISLNAKISLTEEEKAWITNNPVIKVGVDQNWPPFDFVDKLNTHQGISSEYLSRISSKTGLKFEVNSSNWEDVLNRIKNKKLDILACVANTKQRREYLNFTKPYADVDIVVVAKKGLVLKEFDDIRNYVVALPKNNFIHEKLKERFPKIKFKFVSSNEEALQVISYGKADIYVGNLPVVSYYINKYFLTNLEVKFKSDFDSAKLSMAVSKEKIILHNIVQKALDNISLEDRQKINKKWIFGVNEKPKYLNTQFELTQEEINWIQKNKKIKVAGDAYANPFSFINEKSEYVGIIPDVMNLMKEKSDLDFEYVFTGNWSEALELMKEEKIHLLDYTTFTKDRSEYMNFSRSYIGIDYVILTTDDNSGYINSIEKIINKYKVGTVQDYAVSENIKKDYPGIEHFREYENPEEGLKALSSKQIDFFIINIPAFEYYSKKYSLSNLRIAGPAGYSFNCGFGIKKDEKILFSIINKILGQISKEDIDKIYRKWVKVEFEEKIDYDLIWKIVLASLAILLGTLYWNRKLKIEIAQKEIVQEKLSQSKNFINSIMNSQLDIIVVTDGKDIRQVNQSFFNFFKYKDIDSFKKRYRCICDLFDTSNAQDFLIPYKDAISWIDLILLNENKVHKARIVIDEREYIFKVTASKIKEDSLLKTAVFHDITEVENLHKDLIKAKDSALSAAKHKSEFLANMSHEIRTPMNSVIGFTELLDKEIKNPIQKDYLGSIKKGGTALLGIINDILDLSKIEAGKLEIKKESVNPRNLILEVESIFHSKIIGKNINFLIEIDDDIPDFIIIDSIRIRQVLFNLIGNAIKFTEQGDIKLKVQNLYKDNIKSKIDLIISVEDSGIGIDEKYLNNIFNAFEQSDQDAKYGGTGLGLAICSKLVHMMNGKIDAKSKKGIGSIFRFTLHDIAVSSIGEQIIVEKLDLTNIIFEKATILVVDDIEENRKLVQASLKNFDFKIIMAENGQVALDILKNVKINLILMDLRMPVLDGYKTAVIIKNDDKLKYIPLVALTASVMGKDLEKVSKYGFDGYLRKPVIIDDLVEEICKFLKYDFKEVKIVAKDESLFEMEPSKLEELISYLNGILKDEWNEVKDKGDFILLEKFVKNLENLTDKFNVKILVDYIIELKNNIDAFDIEKIDFLMNSYETLVENLIKIERKNSNE